MGYYLKPGSNSLKIFPLRLLVHPTENQFSVLTSNLSSYVRDKGQFPTTKLELQSAEFNQLLLLLLKYTRTTQTYSLLFFFEFSKQDFCSGSNVFTEIHLRRQTQSFCTSNPTVFFTFQAPQSVRSEKNFTAYSTNTDC